MYVVTLPDRREGGQRTRFLVSSELELLLFGGGRSTGALRKLVARTVAATGSTMSSLPLRSSDVGGLVTAAEWEEIAKLMHAGARAISLLPIELAVEAMCTYGKEPITKAILTALGEVPDDWSTSDEENEEEEEEEEAGEEGGGDGEQGGDDGAEGGDGGDGEGGDGRENNTDSDGRAESDGEEGEDGEEEEEGEENSDDKGGDAEQHDADQRMGGHGCRHTKKRRYILDPVPQQLADELVSFSKYRIAPLNASRSAGACVDVTSENNRAHTIAFLGYLESKKGVKITGLYSVFASTRLTHVVQEYAEHLVSNKGLKYATVAGYVLSLAGVARYVHEKVKRTGSKEVAAKLDAGVPDALMSLYRQCKAQVRKQDAFDMGKTAPNWLSWEDCQHARVHAEAACETEVDGGVPLSALHDCCLLTLLTYQPPDRVRLMRTLRLGTSLKRAGEGLFQLNVASPAAHKTAAFFGATRTTLPTAICKRITAYINAAGLEDGDFLFYARDDASESLKPPAWTRLVKACFKRHSAHKVALAPKELR